MSQEIYDIAEVLSFNKDYFREALREEYIKAYKKPMTEAYNHMRNKLKHAVADYTSFDIGLIEDAFEDDRIETVLEAYYLSDFIVKH